MKQARGSVSPVISVDRGADRPLHQQIYDGYRNAIVAGNLRSGQQVPSTRTLAKELGVSRIPVLNAYAQLLAEGYLEGRAGAGTFVSAALPDQLTSVGAGVTGNGRPSAAPRKFSRRSELVPRRTYPWAFGMGAFTVAQLAFDQFPFRLWSNLVTRHAQKVRISALHYADPMGAKEFREAIAAYVRTARAVHCDAKQVMVVSGSQQALDICARVLADPGDPVWIEDPSYALMRHALILAECRLVPVPVDREGMQVAEGIQRCVQARAAFVTPSHQYPLGATMSASRRLQLLDWAHKTGAWIVEDDYDSEYRYESMPISSLQGLDGGARVIYIGTFSKTLFPSLRLGYIVVPEDLVDRFSAIKRAVDVCPPHLYQTVLAEFISQGHFARHIRKMRVLYGERRSALVDCIRKDFGSELQILGAEAGLHLVVTLPDGLSDEEISARAAHEGLWLRPLSTCYLREPVRQGFVIGFGCVKTTDMPAAVRHMRDVITQAGRL